jgi:hypothetical protein
MGIRSLFDIIFYSMSIVASEEEYPDEDDKTSFLEWTVALPLIVYAVASDSVASLHRYLLTDPLPVSIKNSVSVLVGEG